MSLFILRHGHAELQITSDEARNLTEKGRADTEAVLMSRLTDLNDIRQVWASPLVRAQQTAQIVVKYFPHLVIHSSDFLTPEASPLAAIKWLQTIYPKQGSVMLVSHQPFVGELINKLCGKPAGFYPMGTSSLAAIDFSKVAFAMGEMRWLDHI
ncbi:MAG TPA: phosphohistidine phosphatase SixA [Cellvibrio sp.]|nr:phosphohistidine phosphatase SixA [Cellvibrio sp.]